MGAVLQHCLLASSSQQLPRSPVETRLACVGRRPILLQPSGRRRAGRSAGAALAKNHAFRQRDSTVPRCATSTRDAATTPAGPGAGRDEATATSCCFEPSVWGDFFTDYEPKPLQRSEKWMMESANMLKEDVRALFETCNDVVERMHLVDAIQRLGIDHLFKQEICSTLSYIHGTEFTGSTLHEVALWFRLLREHGFWASPDEFNKFMNSDGSFINGIADEPMALLSLYNAAHLLIHNEPVLEKAISFARYHLESMLRPGVLKAPLVNQVKRALHMPLPRTYKRVETLHYMMEYEQEEGHISILLDLAKMEFNLLQHIHLRELKAISEWWKDLYEYAELSYVRDRAVENYLWSYTMFYEEDSALTRIILTKIVGLVVFMDDTYDSHATIQECRKLNDAIQRWDESAIPLLPEYLKKFYSKLLNNFKEFEDQVATNEKYRVAYAKKEFQNLSTYYLKEAEWLHQNHKPSFKEQVELSTLSSTVLIVCVAGILGSGNAITEEAFEWTTSRSSGVIACAKILRFMNDIAAFKRGKNKGDVASSVECYINEHKVTSEAAFDAIDSMVEDQWRTLNQARCEHRALLPAVQRVVNFAIGIAFFYNGRKDAYTFGTHLQEAIDNLFVKPVPIAKPMFWHGGSN